MFEFILKPKAPPIGLDIGHSVIKMIQLSQSGHTICVDAAEEEVLDRHLESGSDEWRQQVIEKIKNLYLRGGFRGQRVVSCLPGDMLKIKSLRLETDFVEEIEDVMRTEVARRFDLNPERDEIRYVVAGQAYQGSEIKNEVIFFGMERQHLAAHIDLIEEAGLLPLSLDTVPTALFRCFQTTLRRREDQDVVSVFVDLGSQFTTVIIGRGQEIAFIKQIPIAGNQLNEQVASRLGVTMDEATELRDRLRHDNSEKVDADTKRAVIDAMSSSIETLAHEISLCFRYYAVTFRGERPTRAAFAGGEAYESALIDALRRHLGVQICVAEPLRGFDLAQAGFDRRPNSQMCEWAIAVGLALRGIELGENQNRKREKETAAV